MVSDNFVLFNFIYYIDHLINKLAQLPLLIYKLRVKNS